MAAYEHGGRGRGRGRGGDGRGGERGNDRVRMSKFLSYVLRHGAEKEGDEGIFLNDFRYLILNFIGLAMSPDGYASVDDLLALPRLQSVTFGQFLEFD